MNCQVISICNEKGGVAKTTTTASLGASLASIGKKVLVCDLDPQASLSHSLGFRERVYPNIADMFLHRIARETQTSSPSIGSILNKPSIADVPRPSPEQAHVGISTHRENLDVYTTDGRLADAAMNLTGIIGREQILRQRLDGLRDLYDYILIDCPPTVSLLSINAMAAADSLIIPVSVDELSLQGLEKCLHSFVSVRDNMNPSLRISGVLITMYDSRSRYAKERLDTIHNSIGAHIPIFQSIIPRSVKAVEASALGISILEHAPNNPVALAYQQLSAEVVRQNRIHKRSFHERSGGGR